MDKGFAERLEECSDFADTFELVKDSVEKTLHRSRAGLMLGLADLGGSDSYYLGAYYPIDTNIIVMNTLPVERIKESKPELLKPYVFHILLHEYLHSLGFLDEAQTRELTFRICARIFGKAHLATRLARDITEFLPALAYPGIGYFPKREPRIKLVSGFDKGNLTYVS